MKPLRVFAVTLIGIAVALVDSGCERRTPKTGGIGGSDTSGGAGSSRDGADQRIALPSTPSSGASIAVIPSDTVKEFVLRFCYADEPRYDPQVERVVIARVGATREQWCELSATGGAWLWGEWKVGTVPRDFHV